MLFATALLSAQKYVPFPTDNANWNVMHTYGDQFYGGETLKPDTMLLQYTLQGDTTISSISYRKLCRNIGSMTAPVYEYTGGIREADKKVYYSGFGYQTEVTLYDFTKNAGDTVWIDQSDYRIRNYIIKSIDSVKVGSEYRKRYKINNYNNYGDNPGYIIEGIGDVSNSGLLGSIEPIPTCLCYRSWEFICFSNNGETVYMNPAYADCNSMIKTGLSETKINEQLVKVYPSLVKDYVTFQFDNTDKKYSTIELLDCLGRCLATIPIAYSPEYKLNLSTYSAGIYFLLVKGPNTIESHKIIKL